MTDGLQEEVRNTVKRDRADHVLRTLTTVGIYVLTGIVAGVGGQVWQLSQQAPQVSLLLEQNSKTMTMLADAQHRQELNLTSVGSSQEALRNELALVQSQITTAQARLQEIERALARKGMM